MKQIFMSKFIYYFLMSQIFLFNRKPQADTFNLFFYRWFKKNWSWPAYFLSCFCCFLSLHFFALVKAFSPFFLISLIFLSSQPFFFLSNYFALLFVSLCCLSLSFSLFLSLAALYSLFSGNFFFNQNCGKILNYLQILFLFEIWIHQKFTPNLNILNNWTDNRLFFSPYNTPVHVTLLYRKMIIDFNKSHKKLILMCQSIFLMVHTNLFFKRDIFYI